MVRPMHGHKAHNRAVAWFGAEITWKERMIDTSACLVGAAPRTVVAVLGPPRSGTSAITRALECLGVDLGNAQDHRTADPANPKGFW